MRAMKSGERNVGKPLPQAETCVIGTQLAIEERGGKERRVDHPLSQVGTTEDGTRRGERREGWFAHSLKKKHGNDWN